MKTKIALILGIWLCLMVSVLAQDPPQPTMDEINDVAENLNCPTCQSLNLADCRTQTCAQWRDQIGEMIAEGYTNEEIIDWYAETYGADVLQEPRTSGIGLFVWLLPILAVLAGLVTYVVILRNWSNREPALVPAEATASIDEEYLRRIEQDLKDQS